MANMTKDEIAAYLAEAHIAHLVTVRATGRPHVAPVWFLEDNAKAYVMADANAVKVRNIGRNPAVSLSIATDQRPLKYVVLNGDAQLAEGEITDMVERICVRYDGPVRGVEFAKELLAEDRMKLIEIHLTRVTGWKDED
ncbi:MAG: hypothetical protein BZY75_06600 [SAR202 cluster bacterium Io17-Chloro-G7]|nr:MAG: hypothetical protein BZY75_06600 [SAR202 cluster bacterium Io17-Chloro-G7]